MKLGIIGTGSIVRAFLPELIKMEGLTIQAIMGSPTGFEKARALCAAYGAPGAAPDGRAPSAYRAPGAALDGSTLSADGNEPACVHPTPVHDIDELCASGIDTVYVAAPNHLHAMYCRQALERGMNVIVEKPFTDNIAQARELADLARSKKLFLFEAITTIYMNSYNKIREWLPLIGDVKIVQSRFNQYSSRYDDFKRGIIAPAFDPGKSGGALMDLGVYNLFYVMGLFGKPTGAAYYPNIERNVDTSGILILQYPQFKAVCPNAKDCGGDSGGVIIGTKGMIRSMQTPNKVGSVVLELRDGTRESYDDPFEERRMIPEFDRFIRAIEERDYDFRDAQMSLSLAVNEVLLQMSGRKGE